MFVLTTDGLLALSSVLKHYEATMPSACKPNQAVTCFWIQILDSTELFTPQIRQLTIKSEYFLLLEMVWDQNCGLTFNWTSTNSPKMFEWFQLLHRWDFIWLLGEDHSSNFSGSVQPKAKLLRLWNTFGFLVMPCKSLLIKYGLIGWMFENNCVKSIL